METIKSRSKLLSSARLIAAADREDQRAFDLDSRAMTAKSARSAAYFARKADTARGHAAAYRREAAARPDARISDDEISNPTFDILATPK